MINRKTRRGIIILTFLAGLSWFVSRPVSEPDEAPIAELDTRMNYVLWDFSGRLLDEKGKLSIEIFAPRLRNNASTSIGTIEKPRLLVRHEGNDWYIDAESAIITADREFVTLVGRVDLRRENRDSGDIMEIETRDVILNVTPRTARTGSAVVIREQGDVLEAIGMELDMINNRYELQEQVQARYETT